MRFSSASLTTIANLITTIDIKMLMDGTTTAIFTTLAGVSAAGPIKASRFFYKSDPFFVGNSTYRNYKNYPFIEYVVETKTGLTYARNPIVFTYIYNVTEVKQSIKCV